MSILGSIIGAGASLAGGLLGDSSAKKAMKLQKDAMQKGIQWKVADAQKAGIHPLFALGASTSMPSAVISPLGESVSAAGQDISRAADALADGKEKASTYSKALASLQLERGGLENELLRSQIRRLNAPGTPPPSPDVGDSGNALVPGQGDSRAPLTLIDGVTVAPRESEAQAQDVENEYGESADVVGALRLARDSDKPLKAAINNWLSQEYQKAIRMDPTGMFTGDYDDMIRLLGWLRGKSDRERR